MDILCDECAIYVASDSEKQRSVRNANPAAEKGAAGASGAACGNGFERIYTANARLIAAAKALSLIDERPDIRHVPDALKKVLPALSQELHADIFVFPVGMAEAIAAFDGTHVAISHERFLG